MRSSDQDVVGNRGKGQEQSHAYYEVISSGFSREQQTVAAIVLETATDLKNKASHKVN